jgi:TonB family protein
MNHSFSRVFLLSLVISLICHLGLVVWLASQKIQTPPPSIVEIELRSADQPPNLAPAEAKKMAIVEQNENAINNKTPDNAKFLGRHNQSMEKEFRALKHGDFTNSGGKGLAGQPKQMASPIDKLVRKNSPNNNKMPSLANFKPQFHWQPSRDQESANSNGNGAPESQTNDYLKNIDPGAQTLLSTREFVYYSYYSRIRTQLRHYWEPKIRDKIHHLFKQGRSIASSRDHITKVIITLDARGTLIKVQVIEESGVRDLDDAAVEAFKAAAPFPNPPKGIVEQDGTIKIRWDFVLEA